MSALKLTPGNKASSLLLQNRIEEWIKDWQLSPADSRDLYLDTAALLRTNKVSSHALLSKSSHTLLQTLGSLAAYYALAKSPQSQALLLLLSACFAFVCIIPDPRGTQCERCVCACMLDTAVRRQ